MMSTVLGIFAAMGVIIIVMVIVGYRFDKKHAHRREEEPSSPEHDPLDPNNF